LLLDLIRVLLAVSLVGVLPGYYWSRSLFPSKDLAVRLTYGIGLSIALVPAVMLIPARVMGLGVTLSATVLSALFVFGTGIVAFLLLGPEKVYQGRIPAPAPAPGLLVLAPFGMALAIAVPYSLGLVSSPWVLFPASVLVILSGFLYLNTRDGESERAVALEESGWNRWRRWDTPVVRYSLLFAVALLVLARGYIGPVLQDWPYIRGVDHYSHAVMANRMLSEGAYEDYLIYPPGFHTMTAMISRLSGLEPIDVFPVLGPIRFS
jgi:hypothetical protein